MNQFIGIPYKSKGRSFNGCDCWGIIRLYYNEVINRRLPEYLIGYCDALDATQTAIMFADKKSQYMKVDYKDRMNFDIVLFTLQGVVSHCGLVLDRTKMLHSLAGHNSVIEPYTGVLWRDRIEGIYRPC